MDRQFEDSTVRHGTQSGWHLHKKRGQDPCAPCFAAKQEYDRRRLSASPMQMRNRLHAKAQNRALRRLKDMAPEVYQRLYREEKQRLFEEADTP